jgi:hypothetical protein
MYDEVEMSEELVQLLQLELQVVITGHHFIPIPISESAI